MTRRGPLAGQQILVTRPERQAGPLIEALCRHGAEPVCLPTIRFAPPVDPAPSDIALRQLEAYRWVCFTSPNGVPYTGRALARVGRGFAAMRDKRLAAVGPGTRKAIEEAGLAAEFVPSPHLTRELGRQLPDVEDARVLLLRAQVASEELPRTLRSRGAHVDDVAVYRTMPDPKGREVASALATHGVDWILFTSPSTVASFVALVEAAVLRRVQRDARVAVIGPVTGEAAREHGFSVHAQARTHTIQGLLDALIEEVAAHA